MSAIVTCGACHKQFDYAAQPETSMGAVKCPHCGATVNQYGQPVGRKAKTMKFPRILEAVFHQPWLITPTAHHAIRELLEARLSESYRADLWTFDEDDDDTPPPPYVLESGIGIVSIDGTILRKASALERMCGAVGVEEIATNLYAALSDPQVRGICLNIDSPGGTVGGVPELAAMVALVAQQKPVLAYTAGQMCSAAYWLGSQASEIAAAPSSEVGSIGVYMPWYDETERYKQEGVKAEIIRNEGADLKGAGYPGTALTEAQRAHLQHGVDAIAEMFHAAVRRGRSSYVITEDTLRGQSFLAAEALQRGLIDSIQPTLAQAVASFARGL